MAEKFPCEYGNKCYRENPAHFEEFSHPWELEKAGKVDEEPAKKRKRLKKAVASDEEEGEPKSMAEAADKKPKVVTPAEQAPERANQEPPATTQPPAPVESSSRPTVTAPIFARQEAKKATPAPAERANAARTEPKEAKTAISSFFAPRKKAAPTASKSTNSSTGSKSSNSSSDNSSNGSSNSNSSSGSNSSNSSSSNSSSGNSSNSSNSNSSSVAAPPPPTSGESGESGIGSENSQASDMAIDLKEEDYSEEDDDKESDDEKETKSNQKVMPKKPLAAAAGAIPSIELNEKQLKEAIYWKPGQPVPFLVLAEMFSKLESTGSRLCNIRDASNVFRMIIASTPQDLTAAVYLTSATVAPAYAGIELGVGDQILLKALVEATGTQLPQLKEKLKEVGDIGLVAEGSRSGQRTLFPPPPLTIAGVFKTLREIGCLPHKYRKANIYPRKP